MSRVFNAFHGPVGAARMPQLATKVAIAVVACLAVRVLWAQAPAPAPAAGPAVPEGVDGRGYKVLIPVASLYGTPQVRSAAQKATNKVKKTLSGEESFAENRAYVENYYNLYYFPFLTQTRDEELKNLGNERQNFLRDLENSGRQPEAHNLVTSLALARLTPIVRDDKFHPAVRYNAMMIIGSLNDTEFVRSTPTLPVPMSRALPILLEEFRRPENSDAVKVAALLGLSRHLEWEAEKGAGVPPMNANLRQEVIKELTALAEAKDPAKLRSAEGHTWMRRRAIEALSFVAAKKPDPAVATMLENLLKDDTQPVVVRTTAAALMGKISYQAPVQVDTQATAKELGYVALVAVDSELNRLAELKKEEQDHAMRLMGQIPDASMAGGTAGYGAPGYGTGGLSGDSSYPGGAAGPTGIRGTPTTPGMPSATDGGYGYGTPGMEGMMDPSMMDPKKYRFDPARRRMRQQLFCVQLGLTGGEDRKPADKGKVTPVTPTPPAGATAPKTEARGMWTLTKPGTPDNKFVDDVYQGVRKLIEIVETKAIDLTTLEKDLRKEMKNLENTIGKKLPVKATTDSLAGDTPGAPAGVPRPMMVPPGGFRGPAGCF